MKKRAALCIRGAISNKNIRYSLKDSINTCANEYINFKAVYASIRKHIIDANPEYDVDIFIHSWSYMLEKELVSLYQPRRAIFEDNAMYNTEIEKRCQEPSDFGGISQALAIKKVIELKESYEKEESVTYDIVILFRPDVLIWTDMVFCKYDLSYFYTDGHAENNGDIFFVMSSPDSEMFKGLYTSVDYGNHHAQHAWIKRYLIKYCNLDNIRSDSLIPGTHYEVLRHIWQTSILNGGVTMDILSRYGIGPDDITQRVLY
jgi:hypothetical protein